jgi:hypothetical protein
MDQHMMDNGATQHKRKAAGDPSTEDAKAPEAQRRRVDGSDDASAANPLNADELAVMVKALESHSHSLHSTDSNIRQRYLWLWRWASNTAKYLMSPKQASDSKTSDTEQVNELYGRLDKLVSEFSDLRLLQETIPDIPAEDMFFDKSVQSLVHEHLPMGVVMIQMGKAGYEHTDKPLVNPVMASAFGYERSSLVQTMQYPHAWYSLYADAAVALDSFTRMINAILQGLESYAVMLTYKHANNSIFEGLESVRINYSNDGIPMYVIIYLQKCDDLSEFYADSRISQVQ